MLLERLLDTWLDAAAPARPGAATRWPRSAPTSARKLEMARDYPRESRLFAGEMLQRRAAYRRRADAGR